ncbi:MAG: hypothetical protein E7K13_05750, partial [Klebsiella grimontii]|nr:hypothetical protein [Klebsiella grimontii]
CCRIGFLPGGAALTGLRVNSALRGGSPDRRIAPPPGNVPGLTNRRGISPARAALSRATG